MAWVKNFKLFKESKSYSNKNIISEICISMVLLNNSFLDNILDRGLRARYNENSDIFLTDLKNMLLNKSRIVLGKLEGDKFVEDNELSKINNSFSDLKFDIEEDWNVLVNSRISARSLIDKLLPDEKLEQNRIKKIYWIGPNKNSDIQEDIVIELNEGKQYSVFLNKNISLQKTSSFTNFIEDLVGDNINNLYNEDNIRKWDKLTQEWVRIVYEGSSKNIQYHIEKFIDVKRIDSIGYFEYFDIRHMDPKFKYLGEYIKEFEKNILKFSDLLNEIWKNKELYITDLDRTTKEWDEVKITVLNSRIIENLLTTSLKKDKSDEIIKVDDIYKKCTGSTKMKLMKALVDKLGCVERNSYFLSSNGSIFMQVPDREFFRKNYDNIDILFDYHVKFERPVEDDNNNFKFKIKAILNDKEIINMSIEIGFSGGEFSGKLNAKYKYQIPDDFSYFISKMELED